MNNKSWLPWVNDVKHVALISVGLPYMGTKWRKTSRGEEEIDRLSAFDCLKVEIIISPKVLNAL